VSTDVNHCLRLYDGNLAAVDFALAEETERHTPEHVTAECVVVVREVFRGIATVEMSSREILARSFEGEGSDHIARALRRPMPDGHCLVAVITAGATQLHKRPLPVAGPRGHV